jgi:hypothetical protein
LVAPRAGGGSALAAEAPPLRPPRRAAPRSQCETLQPEVRSKKKEEGEAAGEDEEEEEEATGGFRIQMTFAENPYFSNTVRIERGADWAAWGGVGRGGMGRGGVPQAERRPPARVGGWQLFLLLRAPRPVQTSPAPRLNPRAGPGEDVPHAGGARLGAGARRGDRDRLEAGKEREGAAGQGVCGGAS